MITSRAGRHAAKVEGSSPGPSGPRPGVVTGMTALGLFLAAVIVGFVFLSPFLRGTATTPFGFDTPHYIWRSNLVIAQGLDGLLDMDPALRANANPDRPAYPVFAAVTDRTLGLEPGWLAFINPAVFAIALGLAGAAFAREVLEEPAWAMPIYLVLLGSSLYVVRTAVGSLDNLQVDGVLIVGATATLLFATRRRGGAGAVLVFTGAFLIHWIFSGLFMLLLLGLAAVLIPYSYKRYRSGDGLLSTPSTRIGGVAAGSGAIALLALGLASANSIKAPDPPLGPIEEKVATRIPPLRVPLSFAIGALGAVALWWPKSLRRRIGLTMLVLWALSLPLGYLLYELRDHHLPLYRVAEFALALPILGAALAVGLVRLGWRHLRVVGAVLGALVVVGAVVLQVSVSRDAWETSPSLLIPARVQQVATAADYLETIDAQGPVIFVSGLPSYPYTDRLIRAGMPGDLVPHVRTFVGHANDLLAGRQTIFPAGRLRGASKLSWRAVEPVLGEDYVAIYLTTLNPVDDPPAYATPVAPGMFVLRGAPPGTTVDLAPIVVPGKGRLVITTVEMLLFLFLAGIGWAAGTTQTGWISRVALAPAFGLAMLVIFAIPVARLGAPLSRTTSWAIVAVTAAAGWVVFALRRATDAGKGSTDDDGDDGSRVLEAPEGSPERLD